MRKNKKLTSIFRNVWNNHSREVGMNALLLMRRGVASALLFALVGITAAGLAAAQAPAASSRLDEIVTTTRPRGQVMP